MKIAVVTGTSTGIGFATSLHLARNGYRVFAGMRNLAKAEPLRTAAAGLPVEVIALDVTSGASIDAGRVFAVRRARETSDLLRITAILPALCPICHRHCETRDRMSPHERT